MLRCSDRRLLKGVWQKFVRYLHVSLLLWSMGVAVLLLTRAVVVADENVSVDVAEADEVVGVLVAIIDAGLVALDASVYDVLGIALVLGSDEAGGG